MITAESLLRDLEDLGVARGSALMVHASLRRVGPIEGGADALLDAILQTLGPEGTMLMVLGARSDEPFDALTTAVEEDMGVLSEVFRTRPGTRVNDHAAARWGANGSRSEELLEPIPLHDYHGPGSVLDRFTRAEGKVLRLGANVDTITLTHWAEYLADLPEKRRVRLRYERADTGEQWIESLDDSNGIVEMIGTDYFAQIWLDYRSSDAPLIGRVGNCTAELLTSGHFVEYAVEWMERHLRGARELDSTQN